MAEKNAALTVQLVCMVAAATISAVLAALGDSRWRLGFAAVSVVFAIGAVAAGVRLRRGRK